MQRLGEDDFTRLVVILSCIFIFSFFLIKSTPIDAAERDKPPVMMDPV
jgi:hypothetical protein